jgi:DNA polymerase-3 subunit epsilon
MTSLLQLSRPLISFDLETTGVDVETDRIVQIAVVKMHHETGEIETKTRKLNPERPIPPIATEVHGIGDKDVVSELPFKKVAKSLFKFMSGCDITGFNVQGFDVPLLANEFKRCGITWPEEGTTLVDAYLIFKCREAHNLTNALRRYTGRTLNNAHDAGADAIAALDVLMAQAETYSAAMPDGVNLKSMVELGKDPDWIDSTGKAKWVGTIPVINFGKWAGHPLQHVDKNYFQWVCSKDFPDDFKRLCFAAANGAFPERLT